jgi:hypothetical protein
MVSARKIEIYLLKPAKSCRTGISIKLNNIASAIITKICMFKTLFFHKSSGADTSGLNVSANPK